MTKKKSNFQQIADELASLSPMDVEMLRFAYGNDNPIACTKF